MLFGRRDPLAYLTPPAYFQGPLGVPPGAPWPGKGPIACFSDPFPDSLAPLAYLGSLDSSRTLLSSDLQKPSDMLQGPMTCFRGLVIASAIPTLPQCPHGMIPRAPYLL